jgi:TorA maturation chaperone TorD
VPLEVDAMRARLYRFLARTLSREPDQQLVEIMASLEGDDSDLGVAFGELSAIARVTSLADARDEYTTLFIGVGRGELVPYGSYYLTGFLNEKPLARLRNDMAGLAIGRAENVKEPEDHAGALMEMMAGLIEGDFGTMQPLHVQKQFFASHIGIWAPHFYSDLENARNAKIYRPVGTIGRLFMAIEEAAFEM